MEWHQITSPGNRDCNEDTAACFERKGEFCFVAADGLGGHGKGEVASRLLAETIGQCFEQNEGDAEAFLHNALLSAQAAVISEQKRQNASCEMKTTAAVLAVIGGRARWGHCGDTRLYVFHKNKVVCRTLDHSVPQMLASAGDIREKDIRRHPDRNRLLRCFGVEWDEPRYVLSEEIDLANAQAFLLCTDGFWDFIDEKTMGRLLKKAGSVREWLETMAAVVEQNGTGHDMDNYTAIAVFV